MSDIALHSIRRDFFIGIAGLIILTIGSLYYDNTMWMICHISCLLPSLFVATLIMACGATIASRLFIGYWHIQKVRLARFSSRVSPILSWLAPIGTLILALSYYNPSNPPSPIPELFVFGDMFSYIGWVIWGLMLILWGVTFIYLGKSPKGPPLASLVGFLFIGGALIQLALLTLSQLFGPISAIHALAYLCCCAIIYNTLEQL